MLEAAAGALIVALSLAIGSAPDRAAAARYAGLATDTAADVTGIVRDSSGAVVPGASVALQSPSGTEQRTVSGTDGRFTLKSRESDGGDLMLVVRADGFAEARQTVRAGASDVEITLAPAALLESVSVTPSRTEQRLSDVPASVSVLTSDEIRQSPAVTADDVLRRMPSFSLFRRASSLSSHPTSQGVSLRGVGPSGVSRTLVLLDGTPFNDPFGGWVYWSRVPLENADRLEVVDSAASSLYGNYAMGGVINIVTARPARGTIELGPQYGSRNSPKLDFVASNIWGRLGAAVDGSFFDTDGYPIVAASERGRVDSSATVAFENLNVKLDFTPADRANVFVRGGYFYEKRRNGKVSTIDGTEEANDTSWTFVSSGARVGLPDQSDLQARVFANFETFRSNFLAVPPATPRRSIGRMTLNQRVPTRDAGGMAQWSKAFDLKQFVTLGGDWRWVTGDSHEDGLDAATGTRVTLRRVSGGIQRSAGFFVQDLLEPLPGLDVTLSARLDHWRNYDAHNLETTVAIGLPTPNNRLLPDKDDTVPTARLGAVYHVASRVSIWGDLGSGFREPTLNELYRQFRVGAVLTLANDQLGPERLFGGELGVNVAPTTNLTWRTTWFDNRLTDPISNVTQSVANGQIVRQRQNLGQAGIRGVQTDIEYRMGSRWSWSSAYLYHRARVEAFAADPTLVGNLLPQAPAHRGSVQLTYSNPDTFTVSAQALFVGRQFDDDQNLLPLGGYTVTDVRLSRTIGRITEVFAGAQNLFNRTVIVGANPTTIGAPRLVNGGVRIRFAAGK